MTRPTLTRSLVLGITVRGVYILTSHFLTLGV
jgi:hypothetical protein